MSSLTSLTSDQLIGNGQMKSRMEDFNNFLVILKVHSRNIYVRPQDDKLSMNKLHSYRIYCHDLEDHTDQHYFTNGQSSKMRVFVLADSSKVTERSNFQYQQAMGEPIGPNDYTLIMSPVYDSDRKVSFAIDLGVSNHTASLEDLSEEECRKIGTAYMYLDPKFATQGIQRMQLIGAHSFAPIGHLQIEYLIVRNPVAYGVPLRKPSWLTALTYLDQGHRGAGSGCRADLPGEITENTIASFNYAARHGADMCELDVMCTSDGVPVVYHDFKLEVENLGINQISQLTMEDLRNRKLASIHDKNCNHNHLNSTSAPTTQIRSSSISSSSLSSSLSSTSSSLLMGSSLEQLANNGNGGNNNLLADEQFGVVRKKEYNLTIPTLEEVLNKVDSKCALNIELKFPQLQANGITEAQQNREINDFVDRILQCIDLNENGRAIVLSTLNPDIAIMLRLKQSRYPVLFLTTGDSKRFMDPLTKSTKSAIHFAKAFDMAGINPNCAWLNEKLVRYAQERGLLVYAWGKIETPQAVKELRRYGLNGIIYDKIDLIKPHD